VLEGRFTTVLDVASNVLLGTVSRSCQFSCDGDDHATGTSIHDVLGSTVAGTAVVPATLKRRGDLFSHDLSVQSGVLDFLNLELGVGKGELLVQPGLEVVDDLPLSADDHTGSLSVDGDFRTTGRAANVKAAETGLRGVLHQELADEQALDVAVDDGS